MANTQEITLWRRFSRRFAVIVSALTLFCLIVLLGGLAHHVADSSSRACAAAALAFDLLALAALGATAYIQSKSRHATRTPVMSRSAYFVAVLLSLVGVVVGLGALAKTSVWLASHGRRRYQSDVHPLLGACWAFWTMSMIAQAFYYALLLSSRPSDPTPPGSAITDQTTSTFSDLKSQQLATLQPPSSSMPSYAAWSRRTSHTSSIRESIYQHILQPMSSRTRLLRQASFQSERPSHQEPPLPISDIPEDVFDTWAIDVEQAEVAAPTRAHLETIPGSRPVSPAKPLDGPFPGYDAPINKPFPPEDRGMLVTSPTDSYRSPSNLQQQSPRSRSSSVNTQSHIHPLFRTDSPIPPPVASPGTVVTASPWGGQTISDPERAQGFVSRPSSRTSNRSAASHRAASPWKAQRSSGAGNNMRSVSAGSHSRPGLRSVRSDDTISQSARGYSLTPPLPDMPVLHRKVSMI